MEEEEYYGGRLGPVVIIVGAGPAGLATAACLSVLCIPFVVLERDDCIASLWRRRTYDRLSLHLAKRFCQLPHVPHPAGSPTFIPRADFIRYLDAYAAGFGIRPRLGVAVESAVFNHGEGKWVVTARSVATGEETEFTGRFLVVATGENSEPYVPEFAGMESFSGEAVHSVSYKNGAKYEGKSVLVVGCGNSGMEIAYDLCNHGAFTSISVRSKMQFHVVTKEIIHKGMLLLKHNILPLSLVDKLVIFLMKLKHGDLSKYGIERPKEGPFFLKETTGRSPVIDVGTVRRIKSGEIKVLPGILRIEGSLVKFTNGASLFFDAIIFATGYKSLANKWLKDENNLLNERGLPRRRFSDHWKGEKGVYCAGRAVNDSISSRSDFGSKLN
ncbi:putative indole-3-pyruvate monooxygenase YUCCA11 [Apostasia shenzhenica]|uniref:indole-3-pyruvate monooxygenase n=1 Tax=Apostasia shenzhenica TaxID=1088818 RepID=A0A2I0AHV8_9ASPA|nr:putative indole-3-pyruvate monooxygenase YUCCA11 [Apostasia shenzhenica]